jgi:uncharacterized protein (TIGR02594 family)
MLNGEPMTDAPAWYQAALKEIGVHEIPENRGPDVRRYIGLAHCGVEGDPWCAIFANAMLESVGVKGTRSASSQSFRHSPDFAKLDGPSLGAIAVFWRVSPTAGVGHVGFYAGERGGLVWILGGNEADQVQIEALPKLSPHFGLIGYWWPKAIDLPTIAPIQMAQSAPNVLLKVT